MIVLRCPWDAPPIRSNQRLHWAEKARLTKQVRLIAAAISRGYIVGPANRVMLNGPVVVTMIWSVTDRRRRDVGASSPTLKAWIDGMVDARLITADDHAVVAEERLRIEVSNRKSVRVEIEAAS